MGACKLLRWLLAQPAFRDGEFHTGYLDELLQQRAGEPFSGVDLSLEEVAAVAAALYVSRRRSAPGRLKPAPTYAGGDVRGGRLQPAQSPWAAQGRVEGLRG